MRLMNRPSISIKMMLLLGLLMVIPAFTSPANAAPYWSGKVVLPYEVTWGNAVLPAGEYYFRVNSNNTPVIIKSARGMKSIFAPVPVIEGSEAGGNRILVTTSGGQHIVRELNSPSLGVTYVFAPLSKAERETMAKSNQVETIPVMISKK